MDSGNDMKTRSGTPSKYHQINTLPPSTLRKIKLSRKPSIVWDHYGKIENSNLDKPR